MNDESYITGRSVMFWKSKRYKNIAQFFLKTFRKFVILVGKIEHWQMIIVTLVRNLYKESVYIFFVFFSLLDVLNLSKLLTY